MSYPTDWSINYLDQRNSELLYIKNFAESLDKSYPLVIFCYCKELVTAMEQLFLTLSQWSHSIYTKQRGDSIAIVPQLIFIQFLKRNLNVKAYCYQTSHINKFTHRQGGGCRSKTLNF